MPKKTGLLGGEAPHFLYEGGAVSTDTAVIK
jgi:hypothetical protein